MFVPGKVLEDKLLRILAEDVGQGDITTALIVPTDFSAEAVIVAKEAGVVAGIYEAKVLATALGIRAEASVIDGEEIKKGERLMKLLGDARTILSAERTLLNILSRMSGIATVTRELREKLAKADCKVRIACTRKSAPGLLYFDKKAVLVGGGDTHRLHLDDMVLIKENHIAIAGSTEKAIRTVREKASFSKKIEVEVTSVKDVLVAARAGVDIIMMDNFSPQQIRKAVKLLQEKGFREKILLEASGGITADNIMSFASTGVDIVSLGEITDNPKPLDISLEIAGARKKAI